MIGDVGVYVGPGVVSQSLILWDTSDGVERRREYLCEAILNIKSRLASVEREQC